MSTLTCSRITWMNWRWGFLAAVLFACPTSLVQAQLNFNDPLNLGSQRATEAKEANVEIAFEAAPAGSPGPYQLRISMTPPDGSYIYSLNRSFGGATKIKLAETAGVEPVGEFTADHPPKTEFSPEFKQKLEKYTSKVSFVQYFQSKGDAKQAVIKGQVDYQLCDANSCRILKSMIAVDLPLADLPVAPAAPRSADATSPAERFVHTEQPGKGRTPKPVKVRIALEPATAKAGDEVTLSFRLDIDEGWHTYSQTQKEGNNATPTEIRVDEIHGLTAVTESFVPDHPHHEKTLEDGAKQEVYENAVTWSRTYRLPENGSLDQVRLEGAIVYQVCQGSTRCLPPREVSFVFPVGAENLTPPTRGNPDQEPPAPVGPAETSTQSTTGSSTGTASTTTAANSNKSDIRAEGLLYVIGAAVMFGFLSLLTPCVFPMIPITVSFFLKQSEKRPGSSLKMAAVYMLSIIGTFTGLGLICSPIFGSTSLNAFANGVALNLFLAAVFVAFSLNLMGLFEIYVPSWLLTMTAGREAAGGYTGIFFMALTFTLTSFTCTLAFLGTVLVWAGQGQFWWPLIALISFSTAFSLPFFLLALFPSLLHKLPKSGGWLNRTKVIMGLVELAFVFKFLSVADISWNRTAAVFDYHLVISAWAVLSMVAGIYLIGKIQLPHDTPQERTGPLQLVLAMSFLGLASYLAVGLFGKSTPEGIVWQQIAAFAPPQLQETAHVSKTGESKLAFLYRFDQAVELAKAEKRPLFLDFTGVNCSACRLMEHKMEQAHNRQRLEKFVRVQLYTDIIPIHVANSEEAPGLLKQNNQLQDEWFQDISLPAYAIATPDGKVILARYAGLENLEGTFAAFLDEGLKQFEKPAQMAQR